MLTDKAISLCVLEILREYTDENHTLSTQEIISKLSTEYNYVKKIDRRTIYGAVETIEAVGYDVSKPSDNGSGYYLVDKPLEPSEAKLLCDAICSFPFIPERHTEQLLKKVQNMLSIYERKQIRNLTVVRPDTKTQNRTVFYNIEKLDEAISKRVKVKFDYLEYDMNLNLKPKREKKYTVNPYGMVYTNEHYYLVCIYAFQDTVAMYRLDRMKNIELTEYPIDKDVSKTPAKEHVRNALYAHAGPAETVTFLCDKEFLNDVVDKFGTDIHVSAYDDARIKATVKTTHIGMKYWALQYLAHVEVIAPNSLREEIKAIIKASTYT